MNQHKVISCLFLAILHVVLAACATVPVTGRQQLSLVPAQELSSLSLQSYNEFLKGHKLSDDVEKTAMVRRVGVAIERAVTQYLTRHGQQQAIQGYQWQFNLVEDKAVNAWCMPGGRVVVYTGILPVAGDETGLAVVMGHEIAHAVANHGGERLSHELTMQLGGMALSEALSSQAPMTRQIFMSLYGAGSQVGYLLPYSRLQESEADRLGLIFMAMAGYDPRRALDFWQRMAAEKNQKAPPEFLSTHPSDVTRIKQIRSLLPEAMSYYRG